LILRETFGWIGNFVFPPVCVGCGRTALSGRELCLQCRDDAGREVGRPLLPAGIDAIACGPLVAHPTRELVHGLKYQGHRRAAVDLVEIAKPALVDGFCPDGSILVPVPLHPHRRRERGYNQSELLARQWGRILSRTVEPAFLARVVDTSTQTKLGADKRRANLEGAFRPGKTFRKEVPVVLVDDVLTTGSTLSACAAALLAAGSPSVRAICVLWAGEA
jgi:ComF family protein